MIAFHLPSTSQSSLHSGITDDRKVSQSGQIGGVLQKWISICYKNALPETCAGLSPAAKV